MTASAQGKDFSSYQAPVTAADLAGLDFAFTKATEGNSSTDPHFAANWAMMRQAAIHRGAYHELWPSAGASPQAQAQRFLGVVRAQGVEPGDMLAVVASDYHGVTDAEVREFAGLIKAAEPRCPVLVYSDLSVAATLTSCTGYDLWVAWPSNTAPASVAPWKTWRLWQWGQAGGVDRDAFNGTAAELSAWIDTIANPPKPAAWTFPAPKGLRLVKQTGDGYTIAWDAVKGPDGQKPAGYSVFTYRGTIEVNHQVAGRLEASEYGPGGKGLPAGTYQTRVWANGAPEGPPHASLTVTLTR